MCIQLNYCMPMILSPLPQYLTKTLHMVKSGHLLCMASDAQCDFRLAVSLKAHPGFLWAPHTKVHFVHVSTPTRLLLSSADLTFSLYTVSDLSKPCCPQFSLCYFYIPEKQLCLCNSVLPGPEIKTSTDPAYISCPLPCPFI